MRERLFRKNILAYPGMGNPRTFHAVSRRWLATMETCWATNLPQTTYDLLQQPGAVHNLRLHNQDLCVCKELLSNASFRSIYEVISQSARTRKFQRRWIERRVVQRYWNVDTLHDLWTSKVPFFFFFFFLIKLTDRSIFRSCVSSIFDIGIYITRTILIVRFSRKLDVIYTLFWREIFYCFVFRRKIIERVFLHRFSNVVQHKLKINPRKMTIIFQTINDKR